jgi:hypothetical protein
MRLLGTGSDVCHLIVALKGRFPNLRSEFGFNLNGCKEGDTLHRSALPSRLPFLDFSYGIIYFLNLSGVSV